MPNNPPQINQINTPHAYIDHIVTYRQGVPKQIGTWTVDYWLWIMDQELRAAYRKK